jgi:AraC-like DNA-binding protein
VHGQVIRAAGSVDRIEARFTGTAFAPHRHDTYAIGITLGGVQVFDYRGATRRSLPGQILVLHPDERHDGRAGTAEPFRYRTIYVEPAMLQRTLGGRPLPFIEGGVSTNVALRRAVVPLLEDLDRPLDELEYHDGLGALADALAAAAGEPPPLATARYDATRRARAYLDAHWDRSVALAELEAVADQDRWQLSRDFRAVFGTSPYRYLILRRLDRGRSMLLAGRAIADVALTCAFADQSHFTRQFKRAFGVTPRAWLCATR